MKNKINNANENKQSKLSLIKNKKIRLVVPIVIILLIVISFNLFNIFKNSNNVSLVGVWNYSADNGSYMEMYEDGGIVIYNGPGDQLKEYTYVYSKDTKEIDVIGIDGIVVQGKLKFNNNLKMGDDNGHYIKQANSDNIENIDQTLVGKWNYSANNGSLMNIYSDGNISVYNGLSQITNDYTYSYSKDNKKITIKNNDELIIEGYYDNEGNLKMDGDNGHYILSENSESYEQLLLTLKGPWYHSDGDGTHLSFIDDSVIIHDYKTNEINKGTYSYDGKIITIKINDETITATINEDNNLIIDDESSYYVHNVVQKNKQPNDFTVTESKIKGMNEFYDPITNITFMYPNTWEIYRSFDEIVTLQIDKDSSLILYDNTQNYLTSQINGKNIDELSKNTINEITKKHYEKSFKGFDEDSLDLLLVENHEQISNEVCINNFQIDGVVGEKSLKGFGQMNFYLDNVVLTSVMTSFSDEKTTESKFIEYNNLLKSISFK